VSLYKSVFTDSSDVERASRFDGTYTFSATYGREWIKSQKDKTLGVNTRFIYFGGLREAPVDLINSRIQYKTYYDYSHGFTNRLKDYVRVDFRISWVKNKPKYTRTLAIDIQNLLSMENEAYHYYDFTQDKKIVKKQLGIIPILIYRIDF
jgi:outer membrane receptor protein involved in Fe transport